MDYGNILQYFFVRDPKAIITLLEEQLKLKLKGTCSIFYHLGCGLLKDDKNIICMASKKYTEKMIDEYTHMFNKISPSKYKSPLEKGDHPELDIIDS